MGGSWFLNFALQGHHLLFLSNANRTYTILDRHEKIIELIDYGYIDTIKNGVIHAVGLGMTEEYSSRIIDREWAVHLQLEDQQLKVLFRSSEKKEKDSK